MIRAQCPHCEKSYRVDDSRIGGYTQCKACGKRFRIVASTQSTQPQAETNNLHVSAAAKAVVPDLGRFKVLRKCGEGAFGAVYVAYDTMLERDVALKLSHPGALESETNRTRVLREPKAAAQLRHPNIVPIFDAGFAGEQFYIATAFIKGKTLKEEFASGERTLNGKVELIVKLAEALDYAHRQGVVHRDVKPGNVMVDDKGEPLLMDFGLARLQESADQLTYDGAVLGTPAYMAPEQAAGKLDEVGPLSDQYSLGVILYEAISGERPYSGPPALVVSLVINDDPVPPSAHGKSIPRDVETICLKAMEKLPAKRFASCQEMADDLKRWLEDRPILARSTTRIERTWRWCRRNPIVASTLGIIALLVLFVTSVMSLAYYREANLRQAADQARQDEADARGEAERQKEVAIEERRLATRNLAVSYLDRGRNLCEQSEVAHGLLWMAKGLKLLPDDEEDLQLLARERIGAWEPQLHRRRLAVQHEDTIWHATFAPSGDWFATASLDNTARLWDTQTGQPLSPLLRHDDDVMSIVISPNGDRVLTASKDRTARLWNVADQSQIGTPMQHPDWVSDGRFSADGTRIVTSCRDKTLAIWSASTTKLVGNRISVAAWYDALSQSSINDRFIVSLANRNVINEFDLASQTVVGKPMSHGRVRGVSYSHDGRLIASGGVGDPLLRVWDATTHEPVGTRAEIARGFNSVAFSPDDRWIATGSLDYTARIWSAAINQQIGVSMQCDGAVRTVAFHPNGKQLLTGSDDGTASVWELSDWKPEVRSFAHQSSVYGVAYCPTREISITACLDHTARLWNTATGEPLGPPLRHEGGVYYVTLSDDGSIAVSGSADRTARVWNVADGSLIGKPLMHPSAVTGVAISPNKTMVLTGCHDGIVRLFDISTGAEIARTEKHPYRIFGVAFNADGSRFATGCGEDTGPWVGELRVWKTETCEALSQPLPHERPIFTIQFVGSDSLWSASGDGTVRLWNAATSRQIGATLQHPATVVGMTLHPSKPIMATGCEDGRIRFWDTALHRPFGITYEHGADVMGLAFNGDGTKLLSGSKDNTARLWRTPEAAVGTAEEIEKRLQVATGLEILENGDLNVMQTDVWLRRQQQLRRLQVQ